MDVALPALSRRQIKFEIGINAGRGADLIQGVSSKWSASQVGVQNHTGGVDQRQQRVTHRLPQLTFDSREEAAKGELQRFLVKLGIASLAAGDFLAKPRQHHADAFCDSRMSVTFDQRLHVTLAPIMPQEQFSISSRFSVLSKT